jgi:hypothetical protein
VDAHLRQMDNPMLAYIPTLTPCPHCVGLLIHRGYCPRNEHRVPIVIHGRFLHDLLFEMVAQLRAHSFTESTDAPTDEPSR